jgi:hypothetical protein
VAAALGLPTEEEVASWGLDEAEAQHKYFQEYFIRLTDEQQQALADTYVDDGLAKQQSSGSHAVREHLTSLVCFRDLGAARAEQLPQHHHNPRSESARASDDEDGDSRHSHDEDNGELDDEDEDESGDEQPGACAYAHASAGASAEAALMQLDDRYDPLAAIENDPEILEPQDAGRSLEAENIDKRALMLAWGAKTFTKEDLEAAKVSANVVCTASGVVMCGTSSRKVCGLRSALQGTRRMTSRPH